MKKSVSLILSILCLLAFVIFATASNEKKKEPAAEALSSLAEFDVPTVTRNSFGEMDYTFSHTESDVAQTGNDDIQSALAEAASLFKYQSFSYNGLIDMLEYKGYSTEVAEYAADNCGADWNEQALKKAENYLQFSGYSYEALLKILEADCFEADEITYALENCKVDWNEEAAEAAATYVEFSGINSREALINELELAGFTHEQAVYGAEQNGF